MPGKYELRFSVMVNFGTGKKKLEKRFCEDIISFFKKLDSSGSPEKPHNYFTIVTPHSNYHSFKSSQSCTTLAVLLPPPKKKLSPHATASTKYRSLAGEHAGVQAAAPAAGPAAADLLAAAHLPLERGQLRGRRPGRPSTWHPSHQRQRHGRDSCGDRGPGVGGPGREPAPELLRTPGRRRRPSAGHQPPPAVLLAPRAVQEGRQPREDRADRERAGHTERRPDATGRRRRGPRSPLVTRRWLPCARTRGL